MSMLEGNLAQTPLDEVLMRLRGGGQTGILTVQNDEDIVAISVEEGQIVGADALNESLEEGLGAVLLGEGLVTEADLQAAATRVGAREGRIGDLLVEEGLVTHADFLAVLRRYTIGLVQQVRGWPGGDYKFFPGDEVAFEEGFEPIRVKELLGFAVVVESRGSSTEEADAEGEPAEGDAGVDEARGAEDEDDSDSFAMAEELFDLPDDDSLGGQMRRRALIWLSEAPEWVARVAPLLVMAALAIALVWRPNSLIYPFFWLESERLELEMQRRASVYQKIDRAAKTYFLLEGRFPDDLHVLISKGLLGPQDALGSGGRVLGYLPGDRGYVIRPGSLDGTDAGVNKAEAIAGDFFLDPEFVIHLPDRGPAPLVLLD